MKHLTFSEVCDLFHKHNIEHNVTGQFEDKDNRMNAVIVFKQGPWFRAEFTEQQRSYKFASDNKYFVPDMCGNSIFGDCLDGTEHGVRLDYYLNKWEIDYCYLVD